MSYIVLPGQPGSELVVAERGWGWLRASGGCAPQGCGVFWDEMGSWLLSSLLSHLVLVLLAGCCSCLDFCCL